MPFLNEFWGCALWYSYSKEVHNDLLHNYSISEHFPIAVMKMNATIYVFNTQEAWIIRVKIKSPIWRLIHDPENCCFHLNSPSNQRVTAFPLVLSKQLDLTEPKEQYSWFSLLAPLPHNPASSHFHFSFHEAISLPVGVTEITTPFPIVKLINSFMINALPAPNAKLRWLRTKTWEEKKVIVNSQNSNNFYLLNILSQMNHFVWCSHFLPSLIS